MRNDSLELTEGGDFLETVFLPSLFYGTQCFPFCLLYQPPHPRFHIYTSPSPQNQPETNAVPLAHDCDLDLIH